MKYFIIFLLLIITSGCGSNYYLKRAKINTYKALARGAKIDSVKTVIHDTITLKGISDIRTIKEVKIDTVKLKELCPEVVTKEQKTKLQKIVCPDVGIDSTYKSNILVNGKSYPIFVHVKAFSKAGKYDYELTVNPVKVSYNKVEYSNSINPSNGGIKWYHLVIVGIVCLIIGFIVGKVLSIGIKL